MTIKLNFDETVLKPLIEEHLQSGISVASMVMESVRFGLMVRNAVTAGRRVISIDKDANMRYVTYDLIAPSAISKSIDDENE